MVWGERGAPRAKSARKPSSSPNQERSARSRRTRQATPPQNGLRSASFVFRHRAGNAVIFLLLVIAAAQLFTLQVPRADGLRAEAAGQLKVTDIDPALRGSIVDRDNDKLAFTIEARALTFQPVRVRKQLQEAFDEAQADGADAVDPQQRLLLEVGYVSLHDSSQRRATLMGGDGGVFVGIERPDWAVAQPPSARVSVYAVTGDNVSVAAGRLSFVLGVHGPCSSVDTACSSALAALHGAWRAVGLGDCGSAAAAAVSLKLSPLPTLGAAAAGMLSVDGRCKTWDARANGYVRSEGVGCTVVAPGGEGVVLLGLAVRQDGRSASLTAPNGSAQRTLLGAALASAGVAAAGVARLEAHGTGTALGDPTEAGSLAATLCGRASGRASPLAVAAAKASIGHSEAASGQAGLQRLATALGRLAAGGNAQLRQLQPPAPASCVDSGSQAGEGPHPCFGRLVADLGFKKGAAPRVLDSRA